jgi:hypothetical protein
MPQFTYLDEVGRDYPDHPGPGGRLGVSGVPGGEPVEMDAAPDYRWAEVLPEKPEKSVKAKGAGPAEKEN